MMSFLKLILFSVVIFVSSVAFSATNADIKNATVRLSVTSVEYNYLYPWQTGKIGKFSGTGFVINTLNGGKAILTNAHVVSGARNVEVKKYGDVKTYRAKVVAISHNIDLALVQVEDSFFEGIIPIGFAELPATQEDVFVYGYPTGSNALSVTKGVFSRLLNLKYANTYFHLMAGQIDAALNHGNSGGPVIYNGKAVGVAMQIDRKDGNEGYGFLIPPALINQFLKDFDDGHIDGIPTLGPNFLSKMVNPSKRDYFHMGSGLSGCLVVNIPSNTVFADNLKKHDIILSIDGHNLFDDGTIEIRSKEYITFNCLPSFAQIGEKVVVKALRDGKIVEIPLTYSKALGKNTLVKAAFDQKPRYFVFSGMVFTPLTLEYLSTFRNNWGYAFPSYLKNQIGKTSETKGAEIVLMSVMLDNETLKGYSGHNNEILVSVNGIKIKNLNHLVEVVEKATGKFIIFAFSTEGGSETLTIVDRETAIYSNDNILSMYQIPVDRYLE